MGCVVWFGVLWDSAMCNLYSNVMYMALGVMWNGVPRCGVIGCELWCDVACD